MSAHFKWIQGYRNKTHACECQKPKPENKYEYRNVQIENTRLYKLILTINKRNFELGMETY